MSSYIYNYIPLYIVIPYILNTQKKTHMFVGAMWENGEIKIVWKGSWPFLEWPDFGVCPTCGSGSKWSKTLDGIHFNWLRSSNLSGGLLLFHEQWSKDNTKWKLLYSIRSRALLLYNSVTIIHWTISRNLVLMQWVYFTPRGANLTFLWK